MMEMASNENMNEELTRADEFKSGMNDGTDNNENQSRNANSRSSAVESMKADAAKVVENLKEMQEHASKEYDNVKLKASSDYQKAMDTASKDIHQLADHATNKLEKMKENVEKVAADTYDKMKKSDGDTDVNKESDEPSLTDRLADNVTAIKENVAEACETVASVAADKYEIAKRSILENLGLVEPAPDSQPLESSRSTTTTDNINNNTATTTNMATLGASIDKPVWTEQMHTSSTEEPDPFAGLDNLDLDQSTPGNAMDNVDSNAGGKEKDYKDVKENAKKTFNVDKEAHRKFREQQKEKEKERDKPQEMGDASER